MKSERPTLEDVASEAGVSRSLVSLALRDSTKVSAQKYQAVLTAVEKLKYRPNIAARNLAQQRSNIVGIVVNNLRNPFVADIIEGIQDAAEERNYQVFVSAARRTANSESTAIDNFINHQADGVIVVGPQLHHQDLTRKANELPLVVIGANPRGVDTISNDDYHGAVLAVTHLLELNHTRIAHLSGGPGASAAERRKGFTSTMEVAGLFPQVFEAKFSEEDATIKAMKTLIATDELPTAIFCANDFMAITTLDFLASQSISVPEEISVIGYDNTTVAAMRHINLTSIDQPAKQMGHTAIGRLLSRIDGFAGSARTEIIEPSLVVRRTTATCITEAK